METESANYGKVKANVGKQTTEGFEKVEGMRKDHGTMGFFFFARTPTVCLSGGQNVFRGAKASQNIQPSFDFI